MDNTFIEEVYETLNGNMLPETAVPGVENLFVPGSACEVLYSQVYDAERRLEKRLGVEPYDDDVEQIISNLQDIQWLMCQRMYYYGAKFGLRE